MAARSRWVAGAFVLAVGLVAPVSWAAGTPVDQATKEQLEAAQQTFGAADVLFDAKRYAEAITAFRASYEIVASPNSRLMIARSLRELGRLDEAWLELEGAIADAEAATSIDEKYATTAKAAREDLDKLRARVGRVTVKLVGGDLNTKVALDGRPLDAAALARPLVVAPGQLTLTAERADGSEARLVLEVEAGSEKNAELDLRVVAEPPPVAAPVPAPAPAPAPSPILSTHSPLRTWAYVAGGVGAAGLVTFGVFGLMNNSKYGSLEDDCPAGRCAPDRQDDIDAGRRFQTIANIGLAVGVIGVGAGTTLFLLSSPKEQSQAALVSEIRIGPGSINVGGRFQ